MRVYHGSYTKIEQIDLSKSKPRKDFGKGFYVTKYGAHAESWAAVIGEKHNTKGIVSEFDFIDNDFTESICRIKRFDGYNEEWLDFIVMNRDKKGNIPAHDYDIVEGPVADDKVQYMLRFYLKKKISKETFLELLTHHEETHQICFCTLNSLQTIDSIDDTPTFNIIMISELVIESLILDNPIDEMQAAEIFYSSKTCIALSDKSTKLYLKPWQEIYEMLKQELKNVMRIE